MVRMNLPELVIFSILLAYRCAFLCLVQSIDLGLLHMWLLGDIATFEFYHFLFAH